MSVIWFGDEEIQQIHASMQRVKMMGLDDRRTTEAVRAAYFANAAAFACTYNEQIEIEPFRWDEQCPAKLKPAELYRKIDSLMYNCISNGGKDFLPEETKDVLRAVQQAIATNALERLEKKEEPEHG
jgi:hypothetical protein